MKLRISDALAEILQSIDIGAIGLPARMSNIVLSRGAENSLDAIAMVIEGMKGERGVGAKTTKESDLAITRFIERVANGEKFEAATPLELSSLFQERASAIKIQAIGLPTRVVNIVEQRGVTNSFDAISLMTQESFKLPGMGEKSKRDSILAAASFINLIENASARELKSLSDPRQEVLTNSGGSFPSSFPLVVGLYLSKKHARNLGRDTDILRKRFGLDESKAYTLDAIGTYYDLTRERVRQIESNIVRNISSLLRGELKTKSWKLCEVATSNYRSFGLDIRKLGILVNRHELNSLLREKSPGTLSGGYLDLLMETYGFIKLPSAVDSFRGSMQESWCQKEHLGIIRSILQGLDFIFDSPVVVPAFEVIVAVKRATGGKLPNEYIESVISSVSDLQESEDGVAVKLHRLRNVADMAFRILFEEGSPVHFSEIARRINVRRENSATSTPIKEANLSNQVGRDDRFVSVGKSGIWALADWGHVRDVTIVEALEQVLHENGSPMKRTDILCAARRIRPLSRESVKTYLNDSSLFTRVDTNTYSLTSWRMSPAKSRTAKRVSASIFNKALASILEKENPIAFPKLTSMLMEDTGLAHTSAKGRVRSTEGLVIEWPEGRKHKRVQCPDLSVLLGAHASRGEKHTLRKSVHSEILSILSDQPNSPMKKHVLYQKVTESVPCKRQTFYSYLREMSSVRQYKSRDGWCAVLDHVEVDPRIHIDVASYSQSPVIHKKLSRALSKLTVEEVDIALYELGLLFENSLKDFLTRQRRVGALNVTRKDLRRLASMIDCVVREKIVTKGHHLNTLREERNERAHGKPPCLEEREMLFNKAHYIAELFVRYICLFEAKMLAPGEAR